MDRGTKIVIAIHNKLVSDLAKGSLSYLGFGNVQTVHNAAAALEEMRGDRAEILIGEYPHFNEDGENLFKVLKTRPKLVDVKVILLTTEELDVAELKRLYQEGINSVVQYPFQMNDLQKALNDVARSVPAQVADAFTKVRQLDFFSFMNDEEILKLLRLAKCRKYGKNDIIFDEGQSGDRFYVIIEGKVSILKVLGRGKEELLAKLDKGACFGEMAIIEDTTRSARAKADNDVLLFELDNRLMDGYDDIITLKLFKKLIHIFSDRLRTADSKIKELSQGKP